MSAADLRVSWTDVGAAVLMFIFILLHCHRVTTRLRVVMPVAGTVFPVQPRGSPSSMHTPHKRIVHAKFAASPVYNNLHRNLHSKLCISLHTRYSSVTYRRKIRPNIVAHCRSPCSDCYSSVRRSKRTFELLYPCRTPAIIHLPTTDKQVGRRGYGLEKYGIARDMR